MTTNWGQPPAEQPAAGGKPGLLRRKGPQLAGVGVAGLILGLIIGGASSSSGSSDTGTRDATTLRSQVTSLTQARDQAISERDQATKRANDIAAAAADAQASAQVAQPSPAAPAAAETGGLADGSFTSTQPKLKDDGLGDFGGTARVTNTSDDQKSASFTFTLYKGGQEVGTAAGVANDVGAGKTATVQLVSDDKYVRGVDKVEFQVDAEY